VVSVGAVWAKDFGQVSWMSGARDFSTGPDRVASFSQRSSALDLVAPGALITSTYLNGTYQSMAGTSMAAPVVAGAAALVREALVAHGLPANQEAILQVLRASGAVIVDGDNESDNVANTGLSFRRVDVQAALASVDQQAGDGSPVLGAIPDQAMSPGSTRTLTLFATDPDGDALTFSARILDSANHYYEIRQQFGLTYLGSYYYKVWGHGEKWLGGTNNQWYCILPNGELRRWAGTMNTTMTAANLVATADAACHTDPSLLWNAQPGEAPGASLGLNGAQLTLTTAKEYTGSFQVEVSVSDGANNATRRFTVSSGNQAPVWTTIPDQTMSRTEESRTLTLTAGDPEGAALSFSAVAVPIGSASVPAVTLTVQGNQLTIERAADSLGKFGVEVTASDGVNSATTTFTVQIQNFAPTLAALANISIRPGRSAVVQLSAGDADGDALSYSVRALPQNYLAYQLDQQLDLSYQGSYFYNFMGLKEKWIATANATSHDQWYCILPNGEVRRHGGTLAATLAPQNLIARLGSAYHAKPHLLWNAQLQSAPAVKFKMVDNQLTITPPANYIGRFYVEVSVTDGHATRRRTFRVKVA
jgi:hypothetical protein